MDRIFDDDPGLMIDLTPTKGPPMRRKLIFGLFVLNGLIALASFATPAWTQGFFLGQTDCCKYDAVEPYCCQDCCWFLNDCNDDADCSAMLRHSTTETGLP